jgi:hypothetical protein
MRLGGEGNHRLMQTDSPPYNCLWLKGLTLDPIPFNQPIWWSSAFPDNRPRPQLAKTPRMPTSRFAYVFQFLWRVDVPPYNRLP